MTDWAEEWPTEPGRYWFWGQPYKSWTKEYAPELYSVKVRKARDSMVYIADGQFLYKAEGTGVWCPAILPEPPHDEGDDDES